MQTSVANDGRGPWRKVNQDYVYASDTPVGNLPNLYIVADGMGGHKAGDLASSHAVQTIVEAISRSVETRPALILQKAIRYANYRLYEKSEEREEYHGMGTTLVVLTVYKDEALAANIGDSRLYGDLTEADPADFRRSFPGGGAGAKGRTKRHRSQKTSR